MLKSILTSPVSKYLSSTVKSKANSAVQDQEALMHSLVFQAKETEFGKDHRFDKIKNYEDFKHQVPVKDYEQLRPYFNRVVKNEANILWPGIPKYFAKTSGTTSGVKYIPITKQSMPHHIDTARDALFNFMSKSGSNKIMNGKLIFLSGSPVLSTEGTIATGRLSGIVNHEVPSWLQKNYVPSFETNCIEPWEAKVEKIVEETAAHDLRLISGIPPWVQMYFEKLLDYTGKSTIKDIFPNFNLFIFGGVDYEPYRAKLDALIGERIHTLETYPASEGFFAFQDQVVHEGLLLQTSNGIFYEFVPVEEIFNESPTRLKMSEIELGVNYAIILNTDAGLWGYNIGDTVKFVSKKPYRLIVTGRVKHFISAFGEHVIAKEVETAMIETCKQFAASIVEFTVAPNVNPKDGQLPYHEWFVEFEKAPENLPDFEAVLDKNMVEQNIYYEDLISGGILRPLEIRSLKKSAFRKYMDSIGKLGGQNKVPRLSNDRKIANILDNLNV